MPDCQRTRGRPRTRSARLPGVDPQAAGRVGDESALPIAAARGGTGDAYAAFPVPLLPRTRGPGASALLGVKLGARRMFITTGVDAVYRDYLDERRAPLRDVTVAELRPLAAAGQFPPGSMGPKVEAAFYFLERGGEEVTVCSPDALVEAFAGRAGTRIRRERA